jgi:hypothetical protein
MRGTNQQVQEIHEVRLATPKQVAMLQRLAKDSNTKIERPFESLRIDQASALIDELIEKVSRGPLRHHRPLNVATSKPLHGPVHQQKPKAQFRLNTSRVVLIKTMS